MISLLFPKTDQTGSSTSVPSAGHDGGRIVFDGTPAALVAGCFTLTGQHLAAYVRT